MNEETHLKIVIAGLLTSAILVKGGAIGWAQGQAIKSTEEIFKHFTKTNETAEQVNRKHKSVSGPK